MILNNYKTDESGNTVLVSSEEVPDSVFLPNWTKLKSDLLTSPDLAVLLPHTSPQGFTVFTIYLTDGQNGHSDQRSFPIYFSYMGLTLTDTQKQVINTILTSNNFTIQIN